MARVFAKPWADSIVVTPVSDDIQPEDSMGFIEVDLDRIAKWYWRVKRWRVDASTLVAGSRGLVAGVFDFYSHARDQDEQSAGGLASEREILLRPGSYEGSMDFGGSSQVYVSFFIEPGIGTIALPELPPGNMQRSPKTWRVKAGFAAHSPDVEQVTSVGTGIPSAATLSFDGINLPLYDSATGTVEWSGHISVYPIEYWPYAQPGGSEPIWDRITGEQLLSHRL